MSFPGRTIQRIHDTLNRLTTVRSAGIDIAREARRLLREPRQQWIDGTDQNVGAVTARDPGKGGGHAGNGVATHRKEDHTGQRHQDGQCYS